MSTLVLENFIDGQFVHLDSLIDNYNPSTGEIWSKIPDSDEKEINAAVEAAKSAFEGWSQTAPAERSRLLMKIADLIEENLDEFAILEAKDQGKTLQQARTIEIPRAVYNFRFFATNLLHVSDKATHQPQFQAINYVHRCPVGVAGLISPWNLPLYLLTFKVAPCLAYGNTCVCKPSEMTSATAWRLCKVLQDAGLPRGVVNMVFGLGAKAGSALVRHPDVKLISFTGGTATATVVRQLAAPFTKKLSLELGGKNPGVIFADADLAKCLPATIRSCFSNQGEICLCTSRLFVERPVFDDFVARFVAAARQVKVGDPFDADSTIGALISQQHWDKVASYVAVARSEKGVTVHCGHSVDELKLKDANKKGYFMLPTVITGVKDDSRLMQEEIFGPVVCVVPFDDEKEVVRRANAVKYGLAATVWSSNVGRIHRVAQSLDAATVWTNCWMVRDLNMPFGGMKESGVGRESAHDSYDFYTEPKTICISYA